MQLNQFVWHFFVFSCRIRTKKIIVILCFLNFLFLFFFSINFAVARPVTVKSRPKLPIPDEDPYSIALTSSGDNSDSSGYGQNGGELFLFCYSFLNTFFSFYIMISFRTLQINPMNREIMSGTIFCFRRSSKCRTRTPACPTRPETQREAATTSAKG